MHLARHATSNGSPSLHNWMYVSGYELRGGIYFLQWCANIKFAKSLNNTEIADIKKYRQPAERKGMVTLPEPVKIEAKQLNLFV